MGPHGRTLSVLVSILGAILLSTNFLPAGATLYINFVAAPGPVPVGGYLQFTTLLLNNVTAAPPSALNVTLSVTCSDSLIILPGATIQSPGCTTRVSVPPYPVGTPVGGPYPGCDPNPLSLVDLNAPASRPAYPTQVSADGHSAIWRNVILPGGARIPSALPFIGLVNYYQPIICLATVTPSSLLAADVIPNSLIGVTGTSRSYLKEGLVYTNVIPPPPPPPSPPGSSPAQFTGSYVTGVPTSTTTLIVIVIFVPIPPTAPPCRPGIVSDTRFTNTTTLVSNTTRCNTTEVRTVTNTTTCVPGGADVFVNTTTTTTTTCLVVDIFPNPTLAPNVTLPPNVTLAPNVTLPPNVTLAPNVTLPPNVTLAPNVTLPPNVTLAPNVTLPPNGTLAPIVTLPPNGTLAPNATDPPPNNGTQAPIQTSGPIVNATDPPVDNSTVPPVLILPTPTPSNTPQVTLPVSTTGFPTGGPIPTTDSPISTTAPPVSTTADPVATTAGPVFTTAPPLPTTEAPVATTAGPVATTASPVATTADPVATTASPVATTADPVATTGIPLPTL